MDLNFGIMVPQSDGIGLAMVEDPLEKCEVMFRVARDAEQFGFDSIWVSDHLQPSGSTYFECWTSMAALSRETSSVMLGQMATCVSFRSPALLAKMAASVDHMCRGRLIVCVGAGWAEGEHEAYGFDYGPSNGYRLDRLEEATQVLRVMWTEEEPSFSGDFYHVRNAANGPKPWQSPCPPLWIAGVGEKRTLRLVAKYADGCNVFGRPETVARKLGVLRQHCDDLDRDYGAIVKSAMVRTALGDEAQQEAAIAQVRRGRQAPAGSPWGGQVMGTPQEVTSRLRQLADLGISHFIFSVPNLIMDGGVEALAEIRRAV